MERKGALLVISGPSGAGKSSLINQIQKLYPSSYFSISTTTRAMRKGEQEGREYFFVSKEEFEQEIGEGYFLEWAKVHGNYYGTSKKHVERARSEGRIVIFDIDVQGYYNLKDIYKNNITSLFITAPSLKELQKRLNNRGTDSQEVIERRLEHARSEMRCINDYDFTIINDDIEEAKREIAAIATAAQSKTPLYDTAALLDSWD